MIEIICRSQKFSIFSVKQPICHFIIKILSFLIHKSYIEEMIDWFSDPNRSGLEVLVEEAKLFFFFDRSFIRASCEPSCLWWLCGCDAPVAALTLVTLVTLVASVGRQQTASVFVLFDLSLQILRRLPRPPVRGCRKSRGQIESLLGHQTERKRLLSPPTYMET